MTISDRLHQELRAYCYQFIGLHVLKVDVKKPSLAWFADEFSDAVRSGVFTPSYWGELIGTDYDPDQYEETERDLRRVWMTVAPHRPFPTDHIAGQAR